MGYFYGRGSLFIGERDANGKFKAGEEFHCPEFSIEVADERLQHVNTSEAVAGIDLDIVTRFDAKCSFIVDSYDETILAMALAGATTAKTTGSSFSAQAFPSGIAVGAVVPIPGGYANLDSLTITDSAGTPATLSAGTHYTVDLIKGLVTFLNLGSYTQPFKAAGAEVDGFNVVSIANVGQVEKFLRFSGVNIADEDQPPVIIDVYRASIKPSKVAAKTSGNDVGQWEFEPMLLIDSNAPFSAAFGKFGRFVKG